MSNASIAADLRTLRILCVLYGTEQGVPYLELPASDVARRAWPRYTGSYGRRSGQWQAMGAVLARLARHGLVTRRVTDTGQKLWSIARDGRRRVEEMPSPKACCACRKRLGAARRVDTFRVHAWHPACDDSKCEVPEHQP